MILFFIKKNVLFTSKRKLKIKLREENILSLMLWSKFKVRFFLNSTWKMYYLNNGVHDQAISYMQAIDEYYVR